MTISKFKAQCLSVMDRVRRIGRPVRVTRYGRPLGFLKDTTTITGDLIAPVVAPRHWNALK